MKKSSLCETRPQILEELDDSSNAEIPTQKIIRHTQEQGNMALLKKQITSLETDYKRTETT